MRPIGFKASVSGSQLWRMINSVYIALPFVCSQIGLGVNRDFYRLDFNKEGLLATNSTPHGAAATTNDTSATLRRDFNWSHD